MKNKRRLLLMVASTLVILLFAGMFNLSVQSTAGNNSTPSPTITNTDAPSDTPSATPTATSTPTSTPTVTPLPSPTGDLTPSPDISPELTATPEPSISGEPTVSDTPIPTPTQTAEVEVQEYYETNVVICNVRSTSNLNVRSGPGTKYASVGKMYNGCYAVVLETSGDWLKITTGELKEMYIHKDYVYTGYEAALLIDNMKGCEATITRTTNLRQGPCISEDYSRAAKKGETFVVHLAESTSEWLCVELDELTYAYIKASDATLSYNMDTGLTNEQIRQNTFAYKLEQALASSKNLPIESIPKTNRYTDGSLYGDRYEFFSNYQMSDLERDFFAATIMAEVGGHPYEGKLAAANVVINRLLMRTGWTGGDTITGVLSKPNQFTGANVVMTNYQLDLDKLERYKSRVNADCYRAVDEAMAGINNIPGYIFFHGTKAAYSEQMGYPVLQYKRFTFIGDTYFFDGYY